MIRRIISVIIAAVLAFSALTAGVISFAEEAPSSAQQTTGETSDPAGEPTTEPVTEPPAPVVTPQYVNGIQPLYPEKKSFKLAVAQSRTISVTVSPENADNKALLWTSSDPSIAKVDENGKVKGVKKGKAFITCTAADGGGASIAYTVTVTARKKGTHLSTKKMTVVSVWSAKYTYGTMQKDLEQLSEKYADLMTYQSIGTTYDDREIYEVTLGNPNAKRHMLVQASMHAREYINSLLAMRQLECVLANYYTGTYNGKYYSELFDKVCLHIVPMVNPDGVSISQFGAQGIKNPTLRSSIIRMCKKYGGGKTRYYTRWKANGRGVDLNRNYPLNWKKLKTVKHADNAMYKGAFPTSEMETKVMMQQFNRIKPKTVISYHSTGSVIYWYFAQSKKLTAKNKKLFNLVRSMTKYRSAGSGGAPNPCYGDWVGHTMKASTLTIETGVGEAPIRLNEFGSIWSKNKNVLPAVALWTINNQ